jgi:hypothetical protein
LSRKFALDSGWLRTSHFANLQTGENLIGSSPEFQVQLENEPILSSDDFMAEYYTPTVLANDVRRTLFSLTEKRQRLRVELEYTLGPNDFFMRKRVRLYPLRRDLPRLLWISVEALKVVNLRTVHTSSAKTSAIQDEVNAEKGAHASSALGQPVYFNDSFFWGMEYPAGRNGFSSGILTCTQDPASHIPQQGFESHSVVAGVSPRGEIADWFLRYLDSVSLPPHPMITYKVQNAGEKPEGFMERLKKDFGGFQRNPQHPFDIHLDAVFLERAAGPEDRLDLAFRQGLRTISEYLESKGSGLGLYLPLNQITPPTVQGSVENSRTTSALQTLYCLAEPKYKEALKQRLRDFYQVIPLKLVKHDLIGSACNSSHHGHPTENFASQQAITDALIEILRLEQSLDPGISISLQSQEQPSPWWLEYANTVGVNTVEPGYRGMDLSPRPRDWEIQHFILTLRNHLKGDTFQLPLSRWMTSDLTQALPIGSGGLKESEDSWADGVAEYLGRGQALTELNFDPEYLDAVGWEILQRGLQWNSSRQAVFRRGFMIGGDPEKGEPYGYLHWNGTQAIVLLKNPSPSPREASFQLPRSLRGSLRMSQTYPRCRLESQLLKAGDIINTSLEGLETRVLEVMPEGALDLALPLDIDFVFSSSLSDQDEHKRLALRILPETAELSFFQAQTVASLQLGEQRISLDSSGRANLQTDEVVKKVIESRKALGEKKAEVGVYAKRGAQLTLPEWPDVTSALRVWLMQPKEPRRAFPLYITLDRKQLNLGVKESFDPPGESRMWNVYSIPLKFGKQVLLDWAVKDVNEISLYVWWEVYSRRPALDVSYTATGGRMKESLTPLLLFPRATDYMIRIPLEVQKQAL